ncbi:MAG TPA: ribonuclease E [Gammaproteobacteria bacterium]|nr:ribonuclease E [Gammaproteobacteria bacterium]
MFLKIVSKLFCFCKEHRKYIYLAIASFVIICFITLALGKVYQGWDDDPDRGAVAIDNGKYGESYSTPVYLDQGWSASESLWFYNTTQGSGLLPYDFFIALEQSNSAELFRSNANIDKYRYLPQKATFFNPDALPVGFVKDEYDNKDYIGYTCAACHTGQVNYKGAAIRIDGGPAMADMVGFLTDLEKAMRDTLKDKEKNERFVSKVINLDNDYSDATTINEELKEWSNKIDLYNTVNHSRIKYGYGRLDAFGRIYNRVLEHVLNKSQVRQVLLDVTTPDGQHILNEAEVDLVLKGLNRTVIGSNGYADLVYHLQSDEAGYPGLSLKEMLYVRNKMFNEPDAPVSYPFLWGIAQSDYVQWNGVASNAGVGPIGRNAGEVIGVFGILDWSADDHMFNLGAWLSGQKRGRPYINFKSSVDIVNLRRLENHLKKLTSPQWPEHILGSINEEKKNKGRLIYARYCESCHELVVRDDWDRKIIAKMSHLSSIGTDPAMANNATRYTGQSGNFKHIYQDVEGTGNVIVQGNAPVVQILTAATKGVVATPDPDKNIIRRWADRAYTLGMAFADNNVKASIKAGDYTPDTTSRPYASLEAYKARSLNGIWATAPYLHNGSVPTLYDLLLPKKKKGDHDAGKYRPDDFLTGGREFDPVKVGIKYRDVEGERFTTSRLGDYNSGHEYGASCKTQADCQKFPVLTPEQRNELVEYLKSL